MQSPEDFNATSETGQHTAILDGTFLADREENGLFVQLFSLHNFYVERWYDPQANRILKLRAFDGTARLAPYIEPIRIKPQ